MKHELEEELAASEEQRQELKTDLENSNGKIADLEEDLYESKTI
jgi:predicted  nucleic acid-binding Zn-ribbon protein